MKAFPFFIPENVFKLKFQLRTDFVVLPVVSGSSQLSSARVLLCGIVCQDFFF